MPFGRERGYDLFEARIPAQRIAPRHQFQLTIAKGTGVANGDGKLLTGQSVVANPSRDHRKIGDHDAPTDCIFFHWKKLNCSPAFADRLLSPPKSGVDQTEDD